MKVTISDKKITPFGGFNFCYKFLKDIGIPKLMDDHLGSRVKYVGFGYSEILMNHLAISFMVEIVLRRLKNTWEII